MALGSDGLITVVGDFDALDGSPVSGKVTFTPSVAFVRGEVSYRQIPTTVALDADGKLSIKLPAADDPKVTPNGFTYKVDIAVTAFVNGRTVTDVDTKNVTLSADDADAQGVAQLSDLLPVPAVGTPTVFLTRLAADSRYLLKTEIPELPSNVITEDNIGDFIEPVDFASQLLVQAGAPDAMVVGDIVRDSNGAATGFDVVWPDGATGRFTGTASTSFPGAIDAYAITHIVAPGGSANTNTYTQAAVTRDANGAVTKRPAITVA